MPKFLDMSLFYVMFLNMYKDVKLSLNCFQSRLVFKTVRETNPEYRSSLYSVVLPTLRSNVSL